MNDSGFIIFMLYADWFIILIISYLFIAPFWFVRNKIPNPKKFFSGLVGALLISILIFYFVIPVPLVVQEKQVGYIESLIDNNSQASVINMKEVLLKECSSKYLNSFQYFVLVRAFRADFDQTFEKQKMVNLGGVEENKFFSKKRLCDLSL